jgi:hypothetical protein
VDLAILDLVVAIQFMPVSVVEDLFGTQSRFAKLKVRVTPSSACRIKNRAFANSAAYERLSKVTVIESDIDTTVRRY